MLAVTLLLALYVGVWAEAAPRAFYEAFPGFGLHWIDADLTTDDWPPIFGNEQFDVVLTATALHWLPSSQLVTTYRSIATVLRPGGLLLNADRLEFDSHSPTCQKLSTSLTKTRWQTAFAAGDIDDWDAWWASLPGHPTLDPLLDARRQRFAQTDHAVYDPIITSFALHTGALVEAGFHEIDTIWQRNTAHECAVRPLQSVAAVFLALHVLLLLTP